MDLTRRQFNLAATSALSACALAALGCGGTADTAPAAPSTDLVKAGELSDQPFQAGPLSSFTTPGVYASHAAKGIFLVSNGGKLIALSALCSHLGCPVAWNPADQRFHCPCHESTFDPDGSHHPNMKAKRPLERCAVTRLDTPDGPVVVVDPTVTFRRDAQTNEFDQPNASLALR